MFLQVFTTILKSTKVVSFMFLGKLYTVDLLKPKEKSDYDGQIGH